MRVFLAALFLVEPIFAAPLRLDVSPSLSLPASPAVELPSLAAPAAPAVDPVVVGRQLDGFLALPPERGLIYLSELSKNAPTAAERRAARALAAYLARPDAGGGRVPVLQPAAGVLRRLSASQPGLRAALADVQASVSAPGGSNVAALAATLDRVYGGAGLYAAASAPLAAPVVVAPADASRSFTKATESRPVGEGAPSDRRSSAARPSRLRDLREGAEVLKEWFSLLDSSDERIRRGLAESLPEVAAAAGPAGIPLLFESAETLSRDREYDVRYAVLRGLGDLLKAAGPAYDDQAIVLAERLSDETPPSGDAAKDDSVVKLAEALGPSHGEAIYTAAARAVESRNPAVKLRIAAGLPSLARAAGPAYAPRFLTLAAFHVLSNQAPFLETWPELAAVTAENDPGGTLFFAAKMLEKESPPEVRAAAAKSLSGLARALGPRRAESVLALAREALRDPDEAVRACAAASLSGLAQAWGPARAEQVLALAREAVQDRSEDVRVHAVASLSGLARAWGPERADATLALASEWGAHPDPAIRRGLAKSLGDVARALGPRRADEVLKLARALGSDYYAFSGEGVAASLPGLAEAFGAGRAKELLALAEALGGGYVPQSLAAFAGAPGLVRALGPASLERYIRLLEKGLTPEGWKYSARALAGLAEALGPTRPKRLLALFEAWSDQNQDVYHRIAVHQALTEFARALGPGYARRIFDSARSDFRYDKILPVAIANLPRLAGVLGPGYAEDALALFKSALMPWDSYVSSRRARALPELARAVGPAHAGAIVQLFSRWVDAVDSSWIDALVESFPSLVEVLGGERLVGLAEQLSRRIWIARDITRSEFAANLRPLARAWGPGHAGRAASLAREALKSDESIVRREAARSLAVALGLTRGFQTLLGELSAALPAGREHAFRAAGALGAAAPSLATGSGSVADDALALLDSPLVRDDTPGARLSPRERLAKVGRMVKPGFFHDRRELAELDARRLTQILVDRYARRGSAGLKSIEFSDGGDSVSDYHEVMKEAFELLPPRRHARPEGLPVRGTMQSLTATRYEGLDPIVGRLSFAGVYGRTAVFLGPGKAVHLKFLKTGEDPAVLAYEHDVSDFLRGKSGEWGLRGVYPRGAARLAKVALKDMPAEVLGELRRSAGEGKLSEGRDEVFFTAYEVDLVDGKNPYRVYLNDPSVAHDEFLKAFEINVHDRFVMARHGLFDLEIIELFHNQEHAQHRRYDWMVDVKNHQQHRSGAGRLNDFVGATLYPNVRFSGPADLASLSFIDDLIEDKRARQLADDRFGRLLNMVDRDRGRAHNYIASALLGDTLLSLALIPPTYLERRGELDVARESSGEPSLLKRSLETLFATAFSAYNGGRSDAASPEIFNVGLMAAQMAYFMTDAYVGDLSRGSIPAALYPGAKVIYGEPGGSRGWTERGWDIRRATHVLPAPGAPVQRSRDLGPVNGANPLQALIRGLYLATVRLTAG